MLTAGARRRDALVRGARAAVEARHVSLSEDARSREAQAEHCRAAARRDARLVLCAFLLTLALLAAFWSCVRARPEPFPSLLNVPSSRMVLEGGATGERGTP